MPPRPTPNRTSRDLVRIATFILFDACVFHETLAASNNKIRPLSRATRPLQRFFDREWTRILQVDYAPIFTLARDVLLSLPSSPESEQVLRKILETALNSVSSGVLMRHDFMGRVYHKLLLRTTGPYYATYYTSVPAAWLLAHLAVKTPNVGWSLGPIESFQAFRAIDPACGSGTLLSATYMALKDAYILARPSPVRLDELHKALVEKCIHGWDVLDYATHLTLTTLSLHSNKVAVTDSNIYTLPAGIDNTGTHLGSLDFLSPQTTLVGRGFTPPVMQQGLEGSRERDIVPPPFDLVIMNPPFSRSAKPNIKFGYAAPDLRVRMQTALRNLTQQLGASGIGQAGLGAHFMLLGLRLAKPDARIGVVIPRAVLSGVSWAPVRNSYMAQTELEYVISNYDPGDAGDGVEPWNWSENTDLGEVMLLARRTTHPREERRTTYVCLWRKPKNEIESLLISHQVIRAQGQLQATLRDGEWQPLNLRGDTVGCCYRVASADIERNWLAPCVFSHPELNAFALGLLDSTPHCRPLSDLVSDLGVDIKQVKDNFAQSGAPTTYGLVWGHQQDMNTIALVREHVGYGRPKRAQRSSDLYQAHAADLLIAERPHLSTEALLAMRPPQRVLTTAFWEVTPRDDRWHSPILLWFNFTYGVIQYLACATSSMGDIFKMKKDQLSATPVCDPNALDLRACQQLEQRLAKQPFQPFAREFGLAATGTGSRYAIDRFFADALRLPTISSAIYGLLADDPVLTKRRRAAAPTP